MSSNGAYQRAKSGGTGGGKSRKKKSGGRENESAMVLPLISRQTTKTPSSSKKKSSKSTAYIAALKIFLIFWIVSTFLYFLFRRNQSSSSQSQLASSKSSTQGLWSPLPVPMTPPPENVKRTACLSSGQKAMMRSFQTRRWNVVSLGFKQTTTVDKDTEACVEESKATIIWTKKKHHNAKQLPFQPWQRYSWIPHQNQMSMKSYMLKNLLKHHASQIQGSKDKYLIPFLPETYILPTHALTNILHRFSDSEGGMNEPWVIKLAATDNGIGIAILGPNSDRLRQLRQILQDGHDKRTPLKQVMANVREEMVFKQPHDTRSASEIQKARDRSAAQNDDIIIQRYVCNELTYKKHKFDLRIYYFIASVNPLVVYYHDGSLRVALGTYNTHNFTSTHDHLTNLGQNRGFQDASAGFDEWEVELKKHVQNPTQSNVVFSNEIKRDPLQHIRNQIKSALAELIASVRRVAFKGYNYPPNAVGGPSPETQMENGFSLMGADFIVDEGLNVFMTETQSSPGLSDSLPTKQKLNNQLLPTKIAILEEIMEKQSNGLPLFPIQNEGSFQLIYTDDFQYTYNAPRTIEPHRRGPCQ